MVAASPLIGRDHPVALLHAEVDRLVDGRGGLVFVTGEAGIGKTALVGQVAADAALRGVRVLNGSCWPGDGAPGNWPWIQVVRHLARTANGSEWTAAAAAVGDELPVLLGESAPADGPAAADRPTFRVQDALTTLLVTTAKTRPTLVVLDDLHWADPASLRTLDFLVRHTWFEPILVVATYRDVEVDAPDHPLRPLLAPLLSRATTVRLSGLDPDGVAALMTRVTGAAPGPDQAADMHRRTGGNPFFIEQTAQLEPGAPVATGVREAVEQRIALLPPEVADVLRCASLIGHEFDAAVLAAVSATPATAVDDVLAPALAGRLVGRARGSRYAFTHDLVRECLYTALSDERRRALHAAVVRALPSVRLSPAVAAHHARRAVPALPADEVVGHLLAAARDAGGRRATEEAIGHLRAALALLPEDAAARRADLQLQLGDQLDRAGELGAAREVYAEVDAAGRALDDAELVARAALGLHRLGNPEAEGHREVERMDEVLDLMGRGGDAVDPALTARVLAAASMARTHAAVEPEAAAELGERAVALARAAADDETLGWCLLAHHDSIWEPGAAVARIAVLDELSAAARRAPDRELEALAAFLRSLALLEQGRPEALDEFATFTALTEQTRLPRHRFLALSRRGAIDLLAGRFDAAHAAFDDAFTFGERTGEVDRARMWRDQVWSLELLRGDVDEALTTARGVLPGDPFTRVLEALTAAHRGDVDEALRRGRDIDDLFRHLPRRFHSMRLVFDAQVAAATGDPARCAAARAALAPLADGWAVHSGGGIVWGPMALWLALVDAAEQRWDDAVQGYRSAVAAADRLGARPWSVLARAHLAAALRGTGSPDDAERAAYLLAAARREAAELGMAAALPPVDEPPSAGNVLRLEGGVWTVRFAGRTAHVKDAKGMRDLRVLVARPCAEVAAVDLLNPDGDPAVSARRRFGADPMLDEQARDAYRNRLRALDGEIRDALDRGADRRAASLDRERAALLDELRRSAGLGGRARRLGDDTERARQAVTARIRDTIRRLRSVHPELAEHLAASVATGTYCRYRPQPPVTWSV
ncbi:AAA ATPase-like protein [Pseudonocardia hierapolitana]|uniref:AAA ATPase-like protein n=1 Tax=Pseudonocardia hierapolitana TaxID=1128676 RepID=A0A561SL26_9PSEU|nr:AAA ATPase-like protein [Pseudonocardia hierapolitana]